MSRGRQIAVRFGILASVNTAVYFVYTDAIRSAKESQVHGKFHKDGITSYDAIVRSSYDYYLNRDGGGGGENNRTNKFIVNDAS